MWTPYEAWHILYGEPLWKFLTEEERLSGNRELWSQVWRKFRTEVLGDWIRAHPGCRPRAWHEFDAPDLKRRRRSESEPMWLSRNGQFDQAELEAIRTKAAGLARHNEVRHPGDHRTNFIHPGELEEFARSKGLLSPTEVETLWPTRPAKTALVKESPTGPVEAPLASTIELSRPGPATRPW